jgi:tRNA nucleotidyltransferase (CCA-adding enzyme)
MNSTALLPIIKTYVQKLLQQPRLLKIITAIKDAYGTAYLVGGAVRDLIQGFESKDIDIEVHGLPLEELEKILKTVGPVSLVGKSFGVLRVHTDDIDWSIPRIDTAGRKPEVTLDPHLSIEQAFMRRDLTINAMGINLHTQELVDPFNGLQDLQEKKLRAPDPKFFVEDPLRFYRVMQFIARFGFYPDEQLNELCKTMDVSAVSRERIESEFEKMLLKSVRPSLGLRWVHEIGRLKELFPELQALISVPQEKEYHPEGDAFEHTMQALDAAARIARDLNTDQEKLILIYAALCHDLGKPTTTKEIDGRIRSLGHEQAGIKPAQQFLARITQNQALIEPVLVLVRYHMQPGQLGSSQAKPPAYKRLAKNVAPTTSLQMLGLLAFADRQGRNSKSHEPLSEKDPVIQTFIERAQNVHVLEKPEEPILQGRDLLEVMGPGPELGKLLKRAYEIQIEENITDKDELKRRVLK